MCITLLTGCWQQKLLDYLLDKPDLYLDEMQDFLIDECQLRVDTSTISRRLKQAGWSNKNLKRRAAQQSEPLRLDWARKIAQFSAEMVVFCDESGTDRRDGARRTGWAPKGVTPEISARLDRGKRWHLLPAITRDGILDLLVFRGHTDKEGFVAWLEQAVFPKMMPFPGPNSILVMDNASWHHDPRVSQLAKQYGVLVLYLPPYSPDFNPIEAYFHDLKAYLRRYYQHNGGDSLTEAEFKDFLYKAAREVGDRPGSLHGHYKTAGLPLRGRGSGTVEYSVFYAEQLQEYIETSTVG